MNGTPFFRRIQWKKIIHKKKTSPHPSLSTKTVDMCAWKKIDTVTNIDNRAKTKNGIDVQTRPVDLLGRNNLHNLKE